MTNVCAVHYFILPSSNNATSAIGLFPCVGDMSGGARDDVVVMPRSVANVAGVAACGALRSSACEDV